MSSNQSVSAGLHAVAGLLQLPFDLWPFMSRYLGCSEVIRLSTLHRQLSSVSTDARCYTCNTTWHPLSLDELRTVLTPTSADEESLTTSSWLLLPAQLRYPFAVHFALLSSLRSVSLSQCLGGGGVRDSDVDRLLRCCPNLTSLHLPRGAASSSLTPNCHLFASASASNSDRDCGSAAAAKDEGDFIRLHPPLQHLSLYSGGQIGMDWFDIRRYPELVQVHYCDSTLAVATSESYELLGSLPRLHTLSLECANVDWPVSLPSSFPSAYTSTSSSPSQPPPSTSPLPVQLSLSVSHLPSDYIGDTQYQAVLDRLGAQPWLSEREVKERRAADPDYSGPSWEMLASLFYASQDSLENARRHGYPLTDVQWVERVREHAVEYFDEGENFEMAQLHDGRPFSDTTIVAAALRANIPTRPDPLQVLRREQLRMEDRRFVHLESSIRRVHEHLREYMEDEEDRINTTVSRVVAKVMLTTRPPSSQAAPTSSPLSPPPSPTLPLSPDNDTSAKNEGGEGTEEAEEVEVVKAQRQQRKRRGKRKRNW